MADFDLHNAVKAFFGDFDEAFITFDGGVLADRFAPPYLVVGADGSSESLETGQAIAAHFQEILDAYYRRGCRFCRHRQVEITPAGVSAAFVSVTWELLGEDHRLIAGWRESYNLVRSGAVLMACASMDHAD